LYITESVLFELIISDIFGSCFVVQNTSYCELLSHSHYLVW